MRGVVDVDDPASDPRALRGFSCQREGLPTPRHDRDTGTVNDGHRYLVCPWEDKFLGMLHIGEKAQHAAATRDAPQEAAAQRDEARSCLERQVA